MIDLDDERPQLYVDQSRVNLAHMEMNILVMEKAGAQTDPGLVRSVFRYIHPISEGAAEFDLTKVRAIACSIERTLAWFEARRSLPTSAQSAILLQATDKLSDLFQDLESSDQVDIATVLDALQRLPGATGATAESPAESAGPLQRVRTLRVLIVEDNFTNRLLLQSFLSRYGDCHVAVNGREAVDAFRFSYKNGIPYDLICMDILMAEMDGKEAVRQVREIEEAHGILSDRGAKIIMTTAVTDIKQVVESFHALCDAYLFKPIDTAALLGHLKSFGLVD